VKRYLGIGALSVVLLATSSGLRSRPAPAPAPAPAPKPFHDLLKKAAGEYMSYGRVDDQARWAPWMCEAPRAATAHVSASKDSETHGRKLYSLFAKDRRAYLALFKTAPVGQVLVKQSWVPEEARGVRPSQPRFLDKEVIVTPPFGGAGDRRLWHQRDHFYPYATDKQGKVYKAARQADLFIMLKLDPETKDTDQGWVYGTVTPDGKKVTSAGRVESCMKCHQQAKHDRLFGLSK
jgi:cytochrome P460